jgi:hypothetical protein
MSAPSVVTNVSVDVSLTTASVSFVEIKWAPHLEILEKLVHSIIDFPYIALCHSSSFSSSSYWSYVRRTRPKSLHEANRNVGKVNMENQLEMFIPSLPRSVELGLSLGPQQNVCRAKGQGSFSSFVLPTLL